MSDVLRCPIVFWTRTRYPPDLSLQIPGALAFDAISYRHLVTHSILRTSSEEAV
jgi:hypothetical protein